VTGLEHYQEAERLASSRKVPSMSGRETREVQPSLETILLALVHAQLAQVAATAEPFGTLAGVTRNEFHDDKTLDKVRAGLRSSDPFMDEQRLTDAISAMQNQGILFRERRP
jgi:hypothetical protein